MTGKAIFSVLTADSNKQSRGSLRKLLNAYDEFELVAECGTGVEAISYIEQFQPDIVFVDLDLADMTGLRLLELLPKSCSAEVVFTTARNCHSIHILDVFSMDYLIKPYCPRRLEEALDNAVEKNRAASTEAA